MEITENKRRIPTGGTVMEDKKFNDILYAYLQSISYRDPNKEDRYVWKNDCKREDLAKALKMNLSTLKRKFNHLVSNGYIVEKEDTFELPKVSQWNFFIPVETLKFLIDTTNEDIITVYAYLGQLKNQMKDKAYYTESKLLILLGYKTKLRTKDENGNQMYRASTNSRDWERINNIIKALKLFGLLTTVEKKEIYNGKEVYKTYYEISTIVRESK
ncbi:hypothetical protein [Clostridium disporicum]|uniref:hypothetical protein n=1 Tax=Clostridium disporicum TaxID=84024 RepID=UPI00266ED067|nr:hypothetical protein [uncultured Clostridium sp.]